MKNVATRDTQRAWVEVDTGALRRNYRRLEGLLDGDSRLLPMLKADGYGVGAVRVAGALRDLGPWGLGVATAEEGAELRRHGHEGRVVVFSACPTVDAGTVLEHGLEPAVSSVPALEAYGRAAAAEGTLPVHLEVDTGMGRLGVLAGERAAWIPRVASLLERRPLRLASTFTHFHSAGSDEEATRGQMEAYRDTLAAMEEAGLDPGLTHAANSEALLRYAFTRADLARPGIYLYGAMEADPAPDPVVRLRARVLDVRDVPEGHTVSYGAAFTTARPSRLATLAIGYGDGLRREVSGRGEVLVEGRRAPFRGAVCMDITVVDVTDCPPVSPGDPVTLLGPEGDDEIRAHEMAGWCGTITYEILTGLGRRLPRVERRLTAPGDDRGDDVA